MADHGVEMLSVLDGQLKGLDRSVLGAGVDPAGLDVDALSTDLVGDRGEQFGPVLGHHPKLHAMPETRFEQTLFLDADLFVLANIEDVFFLLDRFDIAMAHTPSRSSRNARDTWRREFTNAYPQFNSGVMAYRRTEPVLALLRNWGDMVLTSNAKKDQPCLRELLWESDLRVATLPLEFNLMNPKMLGAWPKDHAAPRILHNGKFHSNVAGRPTVGSLPELLGPALTRKLNRVLRSDTEIRNKALIRLTASDVGRYWRRRLLRKLHRWLRPRRVR